MFHVNDKGDAKPCRAKQPANCRYYKGEDDTRHYETVAEATEATEKRLQEEYGETAPKKEIRYSFVKEFRKQEQQFNEDFEGIPNRFFNADLRGKYVHPDADEIDMTIGNRRRMDTHRLSVRMMTALSAPSDNGMNDEEVHKLLTEQGFENIEEVKKASSFDKNAQRGWKAKLEDKDIVIIDSNVGTTINGYSFRYGTEDFERGKLWTKVDLRKIAGNSRAEKKTGVNLLKTIIRTESTKQAEAAYAQNIENMEKELNNNTEIPEEVRQELINNLKKSEYKRGQIVKTLVGLEDSQLEGKNFIAQKKYIKENSGKVAGVFDSKKNTDDVRKDMMKNSSLNKYFSHVELDNDVDPAELRDFEKAYEEIKDKLPPIPKGKEPGIFIKKLGKHRASGLFSFSNNIAVDVTHSGSFIHEFGHYTDLVAKNNASLGKDFRIIKEEYVKNLKIPNGEPESRQEYLSTNTEVYARFFECYADERLGINNRLLDKDNHNNYDYDPIKKNPELKEKAFDLFDKMFDKKTK